ncbi:MULTISPECIES: FAD-dependent oxidoreductase [Tsukamurella]|uniref:FAD-dependent oxidoreductase n=2 Tax=Tsukamurella TaxID=2060 RepID=A0A5C5S127_9ACTN|nr:MULTISPECIES: FAD-dependent oxidoreductase [Tsukamurella]NMD56535.1 NAD(P)-binding protein [Tsukamurella columbiensis]TWS29126.1 FAD-dependent oxidoreductase [Tsukamurella conjunctivitidis]
MPDPTDHALRVVIAGAGIAGLATALRLHRDGHRVLVVERAPVRRTGGYLVNLLGPGFDAAEDLGLVPALRERDQGVFTSLLVRADGSTKLTMPAALAEQSLGSRALTIFRGDLEGALWDAIGDAVEFRFGTTVTAIDGADGPLRVTLGDGTVHDADLLVGADGLHSGVRDLAFGPAEQVVRDLGHAVVAFPLGAAPEGLPEQTASTFIDVGRTAAVFRPRGHAPSAFFTYRTASADADAAGSPGRALAEHFGDLTGPVHDAVRRTAGNADSAYFDSVSQVVMDRWTSGRVALVGDAAWCVSLFAGHGAGLALAGSDRLGRALAEHPGDIDAALRDWETALRPEITKRQQQARAGMARFAPPSRLHLGVQDLMIRTLTAPLIGPALLRLMNRTR